jgi:hypothetical protein
VPLNSGSPQFVGSAPGDASGKQEDNTLQVEFGTWDKLSDEAMWLFEEILQKYRGAFEQLAKL